MARPRKQSTAPRMPSGRLAMSDRGERPEDVTKTALEARARVFGVAPEDASDSLVGTPHGRARLRWRQGDMATGLTATQYEAAEAFARRRRAYLAIVTNNLPSFGSTLDAIIANGRGLSADPADETIARVRDDHAEIMGALRDAGQAHMLHTMTSAFAFHAEPMDMADWGGLRPPLNAIAVRLKINMPDDAKKGLDSRPRARYGHNAG